MTPFPLEAQHWLEGATGIAPQNLRAAPLRGASSSTLYMLHDARVEARRFVLRVFTNRAWLEQEPDLPHHEVAALNEARHAGINAPEPLGMCEDTALFGAPAVLMSHLNGQTRAQPANLKVWLDELATTLSKLHRYRAPEFDWRFSSWVDRELLAVPTWTKMPELWESAFEFWQRGAPPFAPVFIHRDYHPLNVLWQKETLSGVVDWPNACRGPAFADVARCRCNLLLLRGVEAADEFLRVYLQQSEAEYQAFWDIDEVLDFCLPRPEWYRPWSEFGVSRLSDHTLQRRADEFLESVMTRV